MKETFCILTIILLLTSCKENKRVVEKIDFKTDYKFSSEIEDKIVTDTVPWKYQISASEYAKKGDYKNALIHWDLGMGSKEKNYSKEQIDSINLKYKKINASDYIIEKAKENKVVIINEAHHNSFHRVYTKSLLKELYDNGYTNLGLEALANGEYLDSTLNNRKYPILKTGNYIKDPQFGNLVRDALEIGYSLFPYEITNNSSDIKSREIKQAKNIQEIIETRPNEKFLIYCGYDHALEGFKDNHGSIGKLMAGYLEEFTNINPLTINQVEFSESSRPEFNHPFLNALDIKEPTILIDKNNNPFKYERGEAWTDITVFHPNTEYIDDRPNWLFENGNKNVSISLSDIQIEFPVMILAFKKGEDVNLTVPIDIKEVENKTENCKLGLRKGTYEIVVTNGKESFKFEQSIK